MCLKNKNKAGVEIREKKENRFLLQGQPLRNKDR